ncbi:cation acetate symporter [Actinopolyspora erythraea]|uniref:Cation acetate symporter n=1 Tax=Actinopolyspora erythraea TaxID=414996 RepID=A0A099DAG8_9ACTN|nr:cation acetate symporter [Actinopolyspora erythraea]ASU77056.1 cation acetate symporter [Actinopolyspora erythraea]KGI83049.1 sodium:solute symporter [Actinopolyspora erythraea]
MNPWALGGVALIAVGTFGLAVWGSRGARTTSDFLLARRMVGVERNAAAIAGEYLSAASFLGIAGLLLKDGIEALWYPIGYTAGYLALILFVAAPLRRSGAYTLPDFAQVRLDSSRVRTLSTVLVVLIGWLYLVPQLQAAGVTLSTVTGISYAGGIAMVAIVVLAGVLSGGMRVVTLVQAFQYGVKLFAIAVPVFVLFFVFLGHDSQHRRALDAPMPPVFERATTVHVETDVRLRVTEAVWVKVLSGPGPERLSGPAEQPPGRSGATVYLAPGTHAVSADSELRFPEGSAVPVVADAEPNNRSWLLPQDGDSYELFETYSLLLSTFLGTMGLPHVLVRFYTNPTGRSARRTTLVVLGLLGLFYLFPTVLGVLSRFYVPELLVTGKTDAAVLLLPTAMLQGWPGELVGAITAAGAFAAFLSTSSGLVMSVAGVLFTDLLPGRLSNFRLVALGSCILPAALAVIAIGRDISQSVGLAFAMAASTFFPLLVLGIWWRGLTAAGAMSGLVVGGGLVLLAVLTGAFLGDGYGWWSAVLLQPAAFTVPLAFLVTVLVSKLTAGGVPEVTGRVMLRMHIPDRLGFTRDRSAEHHAAERSTTAGTPSRSNGRHRLRRGRRRR